METKEWDTTTLFALKVLRYVRLLSYTVQPNFFNYYYSKCLFVPNLTPSPLFLFSGLLIIIIKTTVRSSYLAGWRNMGGCFDFET